MITNMVIIYHDTIACERYNMLTTQDECNPQLHIHNRCRHIMCHCIRIKDIAPLHDDNNIMRDECIKLHIHLTICRYIML